LSRTGQARVFTDPLASPTGFPFKILQLPGSQSEITESSSRTHHCDLGYLRQAYRKSDGTVGYRCAAEPVEDYVRKGGKVIETTGRQCLCNGLMANIGLGQIREKTGVDLPLITAGNEVEHIASFLRPGKKSYTAAEVIEHLLGQNA
jgi:nitronate monooxygenase